MARLLPEPTRDLDVEFEQLGAQDTAPSISESPTEGGQFDLDTMSLEELQALETSLETGQPFQQPVQQEPSVDLESMSLDELLAFEQQLNTPEKQRIEATPTQLEFIQTDIPGENVARRVTGKPKALQAFEQLFDPFKEKSIFANALKYINRTEEEQAALEEETFQSELVTKTDVFDIDKRIQEIEFEAEGRDLTDEELDELFKLEDRRSVVEADARETFEQAGAIITEPEISFTEVANTIVENPGEMARVMANMTARDPELLLLPAGWAKMAHTAKTSAQAVGASVKLAKGAEIVGGTLGTAGLTGAVETAIATAEQVAERGTIDETSVQEQAKVAATFGGALGVTLSAGKAAAKQVKLQRLSKKLDDSIEPSAIDDFLNKRAQQNVDENTLVVDSAGEGVQLKVIDSKAYADDVAVTQKATEQLLAEQNERFASKLTREARREMGARAQELKLQILKDNERLMQLNERIVAIANDPNLNPTQADRAVRSTRGNYNVVLRRFDSNTNELKLIEDTLLQDRDIGLEIIRVQELNKSLRDSDVQVRVDDLRSREGLNVVESQNPNNMMDVSETAAKKSPKVIRNIFDDAERSLQQQMHNLDAPLAADSSMHGAGPFKQNVDSMWNLLVDNTMGQSVTRIDRLLDISPTARKLRNILRHDQESLQPVPAHSDRVIQSIGKFSVQLRDALDPLRSKILPGATPLLQKMKLMNKDQETAVMALLRGEKNVPGASDPVVQTAFKKSRKFFNDMIRYARDAGHEVGFIQDFFPRVYNVSLLRRSKSAREGLIKVYVANGLSPERAKNTIDKIIMQDGILDFTTDPLHMETKTPNYQPLNQRSLDFIPDAELKPFLVNDLYSVMNDYMIAAVRSSEFVRSFGRGGDEFLKMHRQIFKEVSDAGETLSTIESKRMFDLVNALHGNYQPFTSNVARSLSNGAVTAVHLLTLPLVAITSIVEPFIGISGARPQSWAKGFTNSVKSQMNRTARAIYRDFPADEISKEMDEMGLVTDAAISEHLGALFGGETTGKRTGAISAAFFKGIQLKTITDMTRTMAYEAGKIDLIKSFKVLDDPNTIPSRIDAIEVDMRRLGIDPEKGKAWARNGANVKDPFYREIQEASFRHANEFMVHPDATNRPIFFSNPKFSIINVLLSYPTTFSNTVMYNWYKGFSRGNAYYKTVHGARTASAILAMYMAAELSLALKEQIQWDGQGNPNLINETEAEHSFRVLSATGLLSPIQPLTDAIMAKRYGGDAVATRLGPGLQLVGNVAEGVGDFIMEGNADNLKKAFTRLIPLVNQTNNSREFVYRKMLGGGMLTRPEKIEEESYDIRDPAHRDVLTIWDDRPEETQAAPPQLKKSEAPGTAVKKLEPQRPPRIFGDVEAATTPPGDFYRQVSNPQIMGGALVDLPRFVDDQQIPLNDIEAAVINSGGDIHPFTGEPLITSPEAPPSPLAREEFTADDLENLFTGEAPPEAPVRTEGLEELPPGGVREETPVAPEVLEDKTVTEQIRFEKDRLDFNKDPSAIELAVEGPVDPFRRGKGDFNVIINKVIGEEGGYVNNPNDKGGPTKFGIALNFNKDTLKDLGITDAEGVKDMTRQQAIEVYKKDYWEESRAPLLPEDVRFDYFTAYINSPKRAIKAMQRAAGTVDDGAIGPNTIKAIGEAAKDKDFGEKIKFEYVKSLAQPIKSGGSASWQSFANGWANRYLETTKFGKKKTDLTKMTRAEALKEIEDEFSNKS